LAELGAVRAAEFGEVQAEVSAGDASRIGIMELLYQGGQVAAAFKKSYANATSFVHLMRSDALYRDI
jgi:hypothetical protein